jgi:hypothetical protein
VCSVNVSAFKMPLASQESSGKNVHMDESSLVVCAWFGFWCKLNGTFEMEKTFKSGLYVSVGGLVDETNVNARNEMRL